MAQATAMAEAQQELGEQAPGARPLLNSYAALQRFTERQGELKPEAKTGGDQHEAYRLVYRQAVSRVIAEIIPPANDPDSAARLLTELDGLIEGHIDEQSVQAYSAWGLQSMGLEPVSA